MPHPGLTLALAVGVALGAIIYYLLPERAQPYGGSDNSPSTTNSWNFQNNDQPKRKRRRQHVDGTCSICLVSLADGNTDAKELCCGHSFHEFCIREWMKQKAQCPNCRCDI